MRYEFREIRLGDLSQAVSFAKKLGFEVEVGRVRHTLSLDIREAGETIGLALCLETSPEQYAIQLAMGKETEDEELGRLATDTILRKMQAAGIGVARVRALSDDTTNNLWTQTNWLDRVPCEDSDVEIADTTNDDASGEEESDDSAAESSSQAA